jgi:hypothetical protein
MTIILAIPAAMGWINGVNYPKRPTPDYTVSILGTSTILNTLRVYTNTLHKDFMLFYQVPHYRLVFPVSLLACSIATAAGYHITYKLTRSAQF